jgi:hypothetical protein
MEMGIKSASVSAANQKTIYDMTSVSAGNPKKKKMTYLTKSSNFGTG